MADINSALKQDLTQLQAKTSLNSNELDALIHGIKSTFKRMHDDFDRLGMIDHNAKDFFNFTDNTPQEEKQYF